MRYLRDEPVLIAGQRERLPVHPLPGRLVDDHHGCVALGRQGRCVVDQAVRRLPTEPDLGPQSELLHGGRRPGLVLDPNGHGLAGDQGDDGLQSVRRPVNKADRLTCPLRCQRTVQIERALAGDSETEPVVTVLLRCQHGRPGGTPLWPEASWRICPFDARLYPRDALPWRLAGAVDILGQDTWAGGGAGNGRGRQQGWRDRRKRHITPGPLSMLDSDAASCPLPDPPPGA